MKVQAILLGIVATGVCTSEVIQRGDEDFTPGLLGWSGSLYEGGSVVKYSGIDLDDIDAQVGKDFPGLSIFTAPIVVDPESSPADEVPAALAARDLEKRQTSTCITRFGYGDGFQMNSLWKRIKNGGGTCWVDARRCVSLGCYNTASAAVCNDNHHRLGLQCNTVGSYLERLATRDCIWPGKTCGGKGRIPSHLCSTGIAGQRFSPNRTWNVIAGSCGALDGSWAVGSRK